MGLWFPLLSLLAYKKKYKYKSKQQQKGCLPSTAHGHRRCCPALFRSGPEVPKARLAPTKSIRPFNMAGMHFDRGTRKQSPIKPLAGYFLEVLRARKECTRLQWIDRAVENTHASCLVPTIAGRAPQGLVNSTRLPSLQGNFHAQAPEPLSSIPQ